jgi:hypothetical protein
VIAPLRSGVGEVLAIHNERAVTYASLDRHPGGCWKCRQHASVVGLDAIAAHCQWGAGRQRGEHSVWGSRGHHEGQVARIRTVHKTLHDADRGSVDCGGRLGGYGRGAGE